MAPVDPCEVDCPGGTAYQGCAVAGALVLKCAAAAAVELGSVDCWPMASILQSIGGSIVGRGRRNGGAGALKPPLGAHRPLARSPGERREGKALCHAAVEGKS